MAQQHKQSMFNYFAPPHRPGHKQAQHYEIMDCAFPDRIYCLVIYVKINSILMNWHSEIFFNVTNMELEMIRELK
jgi:hypothetical protein